MIFHSSHKLLEREEAYVEVFKAYLTENKLELPPG
jgi:hypothetical protein